MTTSQATQTPPRRGGFGAFSRASVVLAVLAVQVAVFGLAYLAGRPTLYAVFALGSAAGLVAFSGGNWEGVAAAGAGTAALAVVGWLLGRVFDVPFGSAWVVIIGPVLLTALVGSVEGRWTGVAAATLGSVLLIALGLPLAMFVARQNLDVVVEKALDPSVHRMLYLTIYAPLVAALAALVFGVPLAYLLSRGFVGDSLVQSLVDLPLVVPHSVAGLLILFGFGSGAAFPDLPVLTAMPGMILALVFVSAPFAVNIAREAFEAVDPRLEYASRVHGASRAETFRRVNLPLAARGVLTGGVMAWARAVSEFGAVAVVAYQVQFFYPFAWETVTGQHAPIFIFNTYLTGSIVESSAVGFILLAMSVGLFLLVRWLAYDDRRGGPGVFP
jgi:molybdate/tungstate transport system permease protein